MTPLVIVFKKNYYKENNVKKVILYFTLKYKGCWEDVYNAIKEKEDVPMNEALKKLYSMEDNYISIIDSKYPMELRDIYMPPFSIFTNGNKELFYFDSKVSILTNDIEIPSKLKKDILNNKNIVYVVPYDYDNLINFFLENNIRFIVVLKNGIKNASNISKYNEIIKNNNLIVSEIPHKISKFYEDQSYIRICSGLGRKVLFDPKTINNFGDILSSLERSEKTSFWYEINPKIKCLEKMQSLSELLKS